MIEDEGGSGMIGIVLGDGCCRWAILSTCKYLNMKNYRLGPPAIAIPLVRGTIGGVFNFVYPLIMFKVFYL